MPGLAAGITGCSLRDREPILKHNNAADGAGATTARAHLFALEI